MSEQGNVIGINWNDWFYYDETSPTCLRRKIETHNGKDYKLVAAKKDSVAGGFVRNRKRDRHATSVSINNKRYLVSRIIWEMFNGAIPEEMVIDHLNGDPWDNKLSNLRCKTNRENQQNRKRGKNNTSGVVGLYWVARKYRNGKVYTVVRACLNKDSGPLWATFSVDKLGLLPAWYQACLWRKEQVRIANEEGHMFTDRHCID